VAGGTSVASPIVAAEFGLAGGSRGAEYPAGTLYSYIGDSGALYDVISGDDGSCEGQTSCQAAAGYDGPTGVGSPIGLAAFSPTTGSPANTSLPSVSGTPQTGQTLAETPGTWTDGPTSFGYQWEDCNSSGSGCVPIQGATAQEYMLTASDGGSTIRVAETVSNAVGFGPPAVSSQTAVVQGPPTVKKLSPNRGPEEGGTLVTITGTMFGETTAVHFGSSEAASFKVNSETSIEATAPAGAGTVDVTVTTPYGTSPPSPLDQYGYLPPPTVKRLSTKKGPASGGTSVSITGMGFGEATAVKFGSVEAVSMTVNSETSINAIAPANMAATVDVTVTAAGGISETNKKDHFKYGKPTVTKVSPSSGSRAGGTTVTVIGSGFAPGSETNLLFGRVPGTAVSCASTTECTVTSPVARGTGVVDVIAQVGKAKSKKTPPADQFTYN